MKHNDKIYFDIHVSETEKFVFVPNFMIVRITVWMLRIEINRIFSKERNVELSLFSGWSTDHLYQGMPAHGQFEIIIHPLFLKPRVIAVF